MQFSEFKWKLCFSSNFLFYYFCKPFTSALKLAFYMYSKIKWICVECVGGGKVHWSGVERTEVDTSGVSL